MRVLATSENKEEHNDRRQTLGHVRHGHNLTVRVRDHSGAGL